MDPGSSGLGVGLYCRLSKKIILGLTKTKKGLEDSQKYFGKNCNLDGNK